MTCQLIALCVDASDPRRLARFWAGLLGGTPVEWYPGWVTLEPIVLCTFDPLANLPALAVAEIIAGAGQSHPRGIHGRRLGRIVALPAGIRCDADAGLVANQLGYAPAA